MAIYRNLFCLLLAFVASSVSVATSEWSSLRHHLKTTEAPAYSKASFSLSETDKFYAENVRAIQRLNKAWAGSQKTTISKGASEETLKLQGFTAVTYFNTLSYTHVGCKGDVNETYSYVSDICIATSASESMKFSFAVNGNTGSRTQNIWTDSNTCSTSPADTQTDTKTLGCEGANSLASISGSSSKFVPDFQATTFTSYGTKAQCEANSDAWVFGYAAASNFTFGSCSSEEGLSVVYTCNATGLYYHVYEGSGCTGTTMYSGSVFPEACEDDYNSTDYGCKAASGSSSSDSSCFAGSETVTLESRSIVPISTVRVGDRVLASDAAGKLSFSDVIAVPHAQNAIVATFAEIATVSGRSVKLTPAHLVSAGACGSDFGLIPAGEVAIGSCLCTVDGFEVVESISMVKASGIYTVVTMEEYVVVNGVVASPFAVSHTVGNAFYGIYRAMYSVAPLMMMSKAFVAAHQSFSTLVMSL